MGKRVTIPFSSKKDFDFTKVSHVQTNYFRNLLYRATGHLCFHEHPTRHAIIPHFTDARLSQSISSTLSASSGHLEAYPPV